MRLDVQLSREDGGLLLALLEEVQLGLWEARDGVARLEGAGEDGEGLAVARRRAALLAGQLGALERLEDGLARRWPGLKAAAWWEPAVAPSAGEARRGAGQVRAALGMPVCVGEWKAGTGVD